MQKCAEDGGVSCCTFCWPCPTDLRRCNLEARSAWLARKVPLLIVKPVQVCASPTSAAVRTPPANSFRAAAEKMHAMRASEVASAASWQRPGQLRHVEAASLLASPALPPLHRLCTARPEPARQNHKAALAVDALLAKGDFAESRVNGPVAMAELPNYQLSQKQCKTM